MSKSICFPQYNRDNGILRSIDEKCCVSAIAVSEQVCTTLNEPLCSAALRVCSASFLVIKNAINKGLVQVVSRAVCLHRC